MYFLILLYIMINFIRKHFKIYIKGFIESLISKFFFDFLNILVNLNNLIIRLSTFLFHLFKNV